MKLNKILLPGLALMMAAPLTTLADETEPSYMRSSVYAVLVSSDAQDKKIEEENKKYAENALVSLGQSFANTDKKKAANENSDVALSKLPQQEFLKLEIPNNFNDHNLELRVLDYDNIRANLTDAEISAVSTKKKPNLDKIDEALPAIMYSFVNRNNIAPQLVAKWYGYDAAGGYDEGSKWSMNNLIYRFNESMSAEDAEKAAKNSNYRTILEQKAEHMLDNTFVVGINFSFRSNKAIQAELEAAAQSANKLLGGGLLGSLAATAAGAITSMAMGDGFSVQAYTSLYKLTWDNEKASDFYNNIFDKNASIEDLVALGICKLEPVGKAEKSSASVRQSKFSDKPISDLVRRATARSFDQALAKLQEKNEVFRIITPISKVDEQGNVYARIGMKEGIEKGDEYEILEMVEDENGKITYKPVGKVKAVDKQIWNNLYGAAEEAAENTKSTEVSNDEKAADSAIDLGYTQFKGAKKGVDYAGYYLRLKKKK